MRFISLVLLLFAVSGTSLAGETEAVESTADQIIERAREVQRISSAVQEIKMVLVSRSGNERVREFEMRVRRDGEVVNSYARFSHPSDVAGTQLVVVDHPDQSDTQLLYLPALKRVNRIAGRARSGSFMGSDFAYEDLEISNATAATHTLVKESADTWVIDSVPSGDSSYSRIRAHVSRTDHLPRVVEFYDKKGQALKTLTVEETVESNGTILPIRSTMSNVQKGTTTRLEVVSYELNVGEEVIPDETFTAAYMERNG